MRDNLSILGLKLISVGKKGPWCPDAAVAMPNLHGLLCNVFMLCGLKVLLGSASIFMYTKRHMPRRDLLHEYLTRTVIGCDW